MENIKERNLKNELKTKGDKTRGAKPSSGSTTSWPSKSFSRASILPAMRWAAVFFLNSLSVVATGGPDGDGVGAEPRVVALGAQARRGQPVLVRTGRAAEWQKGHGLDWRRRARPSRRFTSCDPASPRILTSSAASEGLSEVLEKHHGEGVHGVGERSGGPDALREQR